MFQNECLLQLCLLVFVVFIIHYDQPICWWVLPELSWDSTLFCLSIGATLWYKIGWSLVSTWIWISLRSNSRCCRVVLSDYNTQDNVSVQHQSNFLAKTITKVMEIGLTENQKWIRFKCRVKSKFTGTLLIPPHTQRVK